MPVTEAKLAQIELAEGFLSELGFPISRVRHFGDLARVEVPLDRREELMKNQNHLFDLFFKIGFSKIEIDEEGFQSGKLNRAIR